MITYNFKLLRYVACALFLLLFFTSNCADAQTIPSHELTTHRVRLSYVAPERCIQMLQLYGFHVAPLGAAIDPLNLPAIVEIPSTRGHDLLPKMMTSFSQTDSDPIGDLLVFYHPEHPEQLSRVLDRIEHEIDLPARQIMLEAMVLEISESAMNRLGVDWAVHGGLGDTLQLGKVGAAGLLADNQALFEAADIFGHFNSRLQALVREGEAEVLSRPSILTLNNRMAFINVSELIPVPQTKYHGNQAISSVDFGEKEAGIQLAIRPRITADGQEVSLQVNANVSAVVPDKDVIVKKDGDEIARSPTISVREVKTYARIANNTPFIIGGLISRDDTLKTERVPFLGALPYVGKLFRFEEETHLKREVIIVITPFVLPENEGRASKANLVGRNLPRDDDDFDSVGNRLFRDAYRIREEDAYDLQFLTKNEELQRLQLLADQAVTENIGLVHEYPYSEFIKGRIPGERMLVFHQIYSIINRVELDKQIGNDQVIFFKAISEDSKSFDVTVMQDFLAEQAAHFWELDHPDANVVVDEEDVILQPKSDWDALGDRAIALIYVNRRNDSDPEQILYEQVPEVRILDCASRDEFKKLVWELNQPDEEGRQRSSLVLHNESDLQRVKQALILNETIGLNGPDDTMTLSNFGVGRLLLFPNYDADKIGFVGGKIARLALIVDNYYDLLRDKLSQDMAALREELDAPVSPQRSLPSRSSFQPLEK